MELRSNLTQSDSEPALAAQCWLSHPFLQSTPRTLLAHLTHIPLRLLTTPPPLPAGCLAPSHHLSCRTYMLLHVSPQATGVPSPHILVAVLPGLPTAAELFVLPYQDPTGENKRSAEDLEQVSPPGDISAFPRGLHHTPPSV